MTPELFEDICQQIELTELGMGKICEEFNLTRRCFLKWVEKNPENIHRYARAKEKQIDLMAERIIEIADTPQEGITITEKPNGVEISKGDMIQHRRLQIDTRKWLMAKLVPKKYGERLDLTTQGESINKAPTTIKTPDGKEINLE